MTTGYWLVILLIIPVAAGVVGWVKFHTISAYEALGGAALAIVVAWGTLQLSKLGKTADVEIWSGYAESATHTPEWVDEHWETYTETRYTGSGKNRTSHTVTKRRKVRTTHSPTWNVQTSLGEYSITQWAWQEFSKHGVTSSRGWRPDMISGDPLDYAVTWPNDPSWPRYPINVEKMWSNKLRYSESIINLQEVKEEDARKLGLFDYPASDDMFRSTRLLGPTKVELLEWDRMNARVGPQKHSNVILINFGPEGTVEQATHQRAYWHGGKKNDMVICIGASPGEISKWCYVFGWSKNELIKQDLQSLYMDQPADNDIVAPTMELLGKEFESFDWHQFDDLDVPVPGWGLCLAFLFVAGSQYGFYRWAHGNEYRKNTYFR